MRGRIVVFSLFFAMFALIAAQCFYFSKNSVFMPKERAMKEDLVALVGLPDISFSTETHYARHRSLSDLFSYFGDSPELLDYFPSSFIYKNAPYSHPSRLKNGL